MFAVPPLLPILPDAVTPDVNFDVTRGLLSAGFTPSLPPRLSVRRDSHVGPSEPARATPGVRGGFGFGFSASGTPARLLRPSRPAPALAPSAKLKPSEVVLGQWWCPCKIVTVTVATATARHCHCQLQAPPLPLPATGTAMAQCVMGSNITHHCDTVTRPSPPYHPHQTPPRQCNCGQTITATAHVPAHTSDDSPTSKRETIDLTAPVFD
jgi:hypothetical protein